MNKMILRGKRPLTGLKILPVRSQILNGTLKIGDMNLFFLFFYQIDDMPDDFSFVTDGTKTERIQSLKPQDAQIWLIYIFSDIFSIILVGDFCRFSDFWSNFLPMHYSYGSLPHVETRNLLRMRELQTFVLLEAMSAVLGLNVNRHRTPDRDIPFIYRCANQNYYPVRSVCYF